jgi:hypothetical protein
MSSNEKIIIKSIDSVTSIANEAIKDAPWQAKILVSGQVGSLIVAIVMAVLMFSTKPELGLVAIIIALLPTFIVIYHVSKLLKKTELISIWSRSYVDNQYNEDRFEKIGQELDVARRDSCNYLREKQGIDISLDQIRANIFIPDIYGAKDGYAFELYMPSPLQKNMEHRSEFGIKFKAGQGATGRAFLNGEIKYTFTRDFGIDDEHINAVHEDLKWIISIPIKNKEKGYTLAVLNIDGLKEIEKLTEGSIKKIESEFNSLNMKTLFITHI